MYRKVKKNAKLHDQVIPFETLVIDPDEASLRQAIADGAETWAGLFSCYHKGRDLTDRNKTVARFARKPNTGSEVAWAVTALTESPDLMEKYAKLSPEGKTQYLNAMIDGLRDEK